MAIIAVTFPAPTPMFPGGAVTSLPLCFSRPINNSLKQSLQMSSFLLGVCAEELRECVELPALDVDLEDTDERVSLGVLSISISVREGGRNTA